MENEIKMLNFSCISDLQPSNDDKVDEYEKQQAELREQKRKENLERAYLENSNIPLRYRKESLKTYKPAADNVKVFNWVCNYVEAVKAKKNTKNLLYINGSYGTGKTHLGCGIIRELGGYILTSLELCITYDSCRDFKATETRIQFLKRLCQNKVLVIDEVGKGIESIEKQVLPYIINEFYGSGHLLVFLGNGSNDDFNKIVGEASADRMSESGVYIPLIGESIRKRK